MTKYYISLILILLVCLASCNRQQRDQATLKVMTDSSVKSQLDEAAYVVNQACPVHTDSTTTLIAASFRDNRWTYYYEVKEDSIVRFDNDILNSAIQANLKQSTQYHIVKSPDMLTMLRALIKINGDLVYEYKGSETGKSINVIFTFAELRVMVDLMSQ